MTTIVNNPVPIETANSGGNSLLIGIIVLVGFVMVAYYFGASLFQKMETGKIQVTIPAPQVVVPNKVDLNISQTK